MTTREQIETILAESEQRAEAATPGPWAALSLWDDSGMTSNKVEHAPLPGESWKKDSPVICTLPRHRINRPNARLIAASRTEIPAQIKALRIAVDGLDAAAIRFLDYARMHEEKGTDEGARKADRNKEAAIACNSAISNMLAALKGEVS